MVWRARILASLLVCLAVLPAGLVAHAARKPKPAAPATPQETGFLNRKLLLNGVTYRYQVYLPDEWRRDDGKQWPILLFLHGREERGSDGLLQTQIGLPEALREHADRWPFIVVLPQCPLGHYWTDPEILNMAMAALDQESREFNADPKRTYLTGISLGGYGAWELARRQPKRWAAMTIASGGIFWSYARERWLQQATLPREYASAIGGLPIWIFHGTEDPVVLPRQSELMYEAFKSTGGHLRLWLYQGIKHDSWSRAFNEPELPRWLLAHHRSGKSEPPTPSERALLPLHPPAVKLAQSQFEALAGEYVSASGRSSYSIVRQGDRYYQKDSHGDVDEIAPESPSVFFYPASESPFPRLTFERDQQGHVTGALFHTDRHDEHWDKKTVKP